MIHIFYSISTGQLKNESFTYLLQQLPYPIQNQILKFRKWEDRQRSLLGKILLKTGLKSLGLKSYSLNDLKYTNYSKPYFNDTIDFNISHSGEYVVCAISRTSKIGIDIEEMRSIPLTGFESQFSEKEWENVLQSRNSLHSFYTLWTQKESFIKAIGTGLNLPLNKVFIQDNKINWNHTVWFLNEIKLDQRYVSYIAANLLLPEIIMQKIDFQ